MWPYSKFPELTEVEQSLLSIHLLNHSNVYFWVQTLETHGWLDFPFSKNVVICTCYIIYKKRIRRL